MQPTGHGDDRRETLAPDEARALLLRPDGREQFDRLARLASQALRAPAAMLGVVQGERFTLVGHAGVPEPWASAGYLPRDATFCRHVANAGDAFVVDDAAVHPFAFSVGQLENFPRVAYCGAPLLIGGETVAVLSASDPHPRHWTAEHARVLRELAAAGARDLQSLAQRTAAGAQAAVPHVPDTQAADTQAADTQAADTQPADRERTVPRRGSAHAAALDGFLTVDADWRFTRINDRGRELLGLGSRDVIGLTLWELFPDLVGSSFYYECMSVVEDWQSCEVEDYWKSASAWLEMRAHPVASGGAAVRLREITARRIVPEEPRAGESRYRRIFEASHTPLFVMDPETLLLEVNEAFSELLGRSAEALQSLRLADLAADEDAFTRMLEDLQANGTVADAEVALGHAGGGDVVCLISGTAQSMDGGAVYHGAIRDITAQKRAEERLVRTAFQDPLTGLPNRIVFMDRLERVLRYSQRRPGYSFAVLFLDLDNFKLINDSHGHLFGDQLLNAVARRLESCVRQGDTVARIGGDEFAMLLDMIPDAASVTFVVDRIREALAEPFIAEGGHADATTASIGIAISLSNYDRAEDLLRDADAAMYRAKTAGRNDYVIFDADMHDRALAQRQLEEDLRAAVLHDQLTLQYHPIVELETGAITGLEALVRWAHPGRGVLQPAEFMPLAEQTGLITEIGWWVLREACRQMHEWQHDHPEASARMTMSVNLSARQFVHQEMVDKIDEVLAETGLAPSWLRLDVTEAVVMQNADLAVRVLRQLRERGIQICLDDFGTGFSSLRQLRAFPISTLKIDRSFIGQLEDEGEAFEIVQSIIALGRSMAIDTIAEGVETPEQLARLRQLGARYAQGFLFSLPLGGEDISELLQESVVR
jgi:diguanylate cyclase (GGDEF)-like protein/PAS domain S-box-containing protein